MSEDKKKPTKKTAKNETAKTEPAPDQSNAEEELFLPEISMPEAAQNVVKDYYSRAKYVLEYGSGGSTVLGASCKNIKALYSIESDRRWTRRLRHGITNKYPDANVDIRWVDIGPTKKWGQPENTENYRRFPSYPLAIWDDLDEHQPDVVLIDGRFRMGCFMATIFRTKKPVTILFDDYEGRPRYKRIERYFEPVEMYDRMARFEVKPVKIDAKDLLFVIQQFGVVM